MLILLIGILIVSIILCVISWNNDWAFVDITSTIICVILSIVIFIMALIAIPEFLKTLVIDDKITMHEEENKSIEAQITEIANNYQGYEKEIISNVADMETMLIKIPELKSSELVKKQMEVYIANNDKIKELKEEKIDTRIYKWLLYFG